MVNMSRNEGEPMYFCDACGNPCELSSRKVPFKGYSTIPKVRKVTGEREVFVSIWAKCQGRSAISGEKLLPPEHPLFHFQFAHILAKGTYPELRLVEENIFPVTVAEHHYQTTDPGACQKDPLWSKFWAKHEELKRSRYVDRVAS